MQGGRKRTGENTVNELKWEGGGGKKKVNAKTMGLGGVKRKREDSIRKTETDLYNKTKLQARL